jgi:hypothetical protein
MSSSEQQSSRPETLRQKPQGMLQCVRIHAASVSSAATADFVASFGQAATAHASKSPISGAKHLPSRAHVQRAEQAVPTEQVSASGQQEAMTHASQAVCPDDWQDQASAAV